MEKQDKSEIWYKAKIYDKFWKSYNKIMFEYHTKTIDNCKYNEKITKDGLNNMLKNRSFSQSPHTNNKYCRRTHKYSKKKRNRRRKKSSSYNDHLTFGNSQERRLAQQAEMLPMQIEESMQINDDEPHSDVDEEFLKFMEVTEKHHRDRRQNDTDEIINKYMNLCDPTKEHPDVTRSREMRLLYGENSQRIYAMETAMQLSFDRISTVHQPKFWPEVPFNIKFS